MEEIEASWKNPPGRSFLNINRGDGQQTGTTYLQVTVLPVALLY